MKFCKVWYFRAIIWILHVYIWVAFAFMLGRPRPQSKGCGEWPRGWGVGPLGVGGGFELEFDDIHSSLLHIIIITDNCRGLWVTLHEIFLFLQIFKSFSKVFSWIFQAFSKFVQFFSIFPQNAPFKHNFFSKTWKRHVLGVWRWRFLKNFQRHLRSRKRHYGAKAPDLVTLVYYPEQAQRDMSDFNI